MPQWLDHWIYEVWLSDTYDAVEEPKYRMDWHFSFLPLRFLGEDEEESIYFSRAYRPGGSIGECRELAETELLEFYRELLKSNIQQ